MADDRRTSTTNPASGNEGGGGTAREGTVTPLRNPAADAARQGAAAGADMARQSMAAGAEASRRVAEGAAEQAGQVTRQLAEAAEIYQSAARRIAEEVRAFASAPMSAAGGVQDLSRAWAEWLQDAVQANARFPQEMLRARSLTELAQVQARFVEESLSRLREGGARVLEAAGGLAERVRDPLQEGGGGEGNDEEEDEGPVTVADVMTRGVRVASPEDTVQEAAAVMARADTGVLPVGEDDRIIGMLTDRDIAVRIAAAGKDPAKAKVREAMTPGVEYCFEDEEIDAVIEKMAQQRLRRLPVLSREKRLVGIVSVGDLATEQPDPGAVGRALGGIAQEGGPHRQRPVRPKKSATPPASRQRQQRRR